MTESESSQKCFGARNISPDEQPDHSWGLEQLGQYARDQHQAIVRGEQTLAPLYWWLGQALQLARKELGRSHWGRFLADQGINRVRACRARAIVRAFPTVAAIAGRSVEEAYECRVRRQVHAARKSRKVTAADSPEELPADQTSREASEDDIEMFLCDVAERAERLIDVAAFAQTDRRRSFRNKTNKPLAAASFVRRSSGGR
jgi:hypothetical protein